MPQHRYRNTVRFLMEPIWQNVQKIPIFLSAFCLGVMIPAVSQAQIIPDNTLPANSTVTPQGNVNLIQGGTTAGSNLFHSFREFSIPTNGTAYFNNALNIQNIFTRVTGSSISNIDGIIQANGTANLFLMNPNGLIFGPNASLNIGGSFLASTASQINFADGTQFSATSPQTTPLLTVSVPIGLQMGGNPGNIMVQGPGNNLTTDPTTFETIKDNRPAGLQIQAQTLALVGGDINLLGGNLTSVGGRIELGSVGSNSIVNLTPTPKGFTLGYTDIKSFQDIQLTEGSIDSSGPSSGPIQLQGRSLFLTEGSAIIASTTGNQPGQDITLRALEIVELSGANVLELPSAIRANLNSGAIGTGGNLGIETSRLKLKDGAILSTVTTGQGNAGNLSIFATDLVELSGLDRQGFGSLITTGVRSNAIGNAGNLTIGTGRLTLTDGANISSSTSGQGNGGDLTIRATEAVELSGLDIDGAVSNLLTTVSSTAIGNAGNLTIDTSQLTLSDGANISSSNLGQGNGGDLTIRATEAVQLSGLDIDGLGSRVGILIGLETVGNAGNLTIETSRLTLADGAFISTSNLGQGNSGNLIIRATDLVQLSGLNGFGLGSSLLTEVFSDAMGNAGNLTIETGRLTLADGAFISSSTGAQGNGGDITIRATDSVQLSGLDSLGKGSSLLTQVGSEAVGNAGTISIETGRLTLADGAFISSSTGGQGNGGNLTIRATDLVQLSGSDGGGSRLLTTVEPEAVGNAGSISIETGRLTLADGTNISTSSLGQGNSGNLTIRATDSVQLSGLDNSGLPSSLLTQVFSDAVGDAGNLMIETGRLTLTDGADISSSSLGQGNSGNLIIRATDSVQLSGLNGFEFGSSLRTQVGPEAGGDAGNLTIETGRLTLTDGANISSSTSGQGNGGDLTIRATDSVQLSGLDNSGLGSSLLTEVGSEATGSAGNLTIETGRLTLADGANISSSSLGQGNGGDLTIRAINSVQLSGLDTDGLPSNLLTQVFSDAVGDAGNITIETDRLTLADGAFISSSSLGQGNSGNLMIRATDSVELSGLNGFGGGSNLLTIVFPNAIGEAGNLTIESNQIIFRDGAIISTETLGNGNAGNLTIWAKQLNLLDGSQIRVVGQGRFSPGTLTINAQEILLDNQANLSAQTESGNQGNINLNTQLLILRRNSSINTNATGTATGGNINLNTGILAALENSDISANSQQAQGGNVTINAQAIFGSQFRTREQLEALLNTTDPLLLDPSRLPSSDITATGADSSLSGTVSVNTPDIDPTQGLLELPETPVDATRLVASTCQTGEKQSQFTVTGRGGLPPNPYEMIADQATWIDLRTSETITSEHEINRNPLTSNQPEMIQLIEAQGWTINPQGKVQLVAQVPATIPSQSTRFLPANSCLTN